MYTKFLGILTTLFFVILILYSTKRFPHEYKTNNTIIIDGIAFVREYKKIDNELQ